MQTDVDGLGASVDLTAWSLGAGYDFGNSLSAYGSVGRLNIGLGSLGNFDAKGVTIGAAYDLSSQVAPIILSAELSHTTIDGILGIYPDINRFAVGVTIPLGGGAREPLKSNTRAARGDYCSAIAALANSL